MNDDTDTADIVKAAAVKAIDEETDEREEELC